MWHFVASPLLWHFFCTYIYIYISADPVRGSSACEAVPPWPPWSLLLGTKNGNFSRGVGMSDQPYQNRCKILVEANLNLLRDLYSKKIARFIEKLLQDNSKTLQTGRVQGDKIETLNRKRLLAWFFFFPPRPSTPDGIANRLKRVFENLRGRRNGVSF